MLTAANIVEGAYYAMDHAGQLIHDAATLYERKRWPSSLVLAVLAMEEMGKVETLLSRASDAAIAGPKSATEVMKGLAHHQLKLKSGRGLYSIPKGISFWGDMPEQGTPEMEEINRQIEEKYRIEQEKAPGVAHAARTRALYVDLDDEIWTRPAETTAIDAYQMLHAAGIEYHMRRKKFVNPTDATIQEALLEMCRRAGDLLEAPVVNWPEKQ